MDTIQAPNMQQYAIISRPLMSKWWWINFFFACVVFLSVGGALLGIYLSAGDSICYSSPNSSYYRHDVDPSVLIGGFTMVALGIFCKITAWILLIIYCVKRRRFTKANITYVNTSPATPHSIQMAQLSRSPANPAATTPRYCGDCGATVSSKFCPQCGVSTNQMPTE